MDIEKTQIVIIGAGLTGLTLAYYLKKQGKDVLIIEKTDKTGGVIQTENHNDFIYETGPNTGVVGNPEVAELFEELEGLCTFEAANTDAKRRLIWKKDKWHAIPSGMVSAIKTPLFTLNDKFRVLGEPFRKKGTNANETLSEFVKRRLGCSFLNYAVDPFISGVYAGDPNYLITRFALPKLYALEQNYGSFIKGSINKAKERKHNLRLQKATREVFSVQGGLKNLINALTEKVGANNILLNVKNTSIKLTTKGFEISTTINNETIIIHSKKVITTTGGYELKNLLPFLSDEELAPFEELKYASVVQAIVGYKNWEGIKLNAFGGLVPTIEHRDILGVLFNSSFLNGRSPKNGALLSVFLGGTKRPDIFEMNDNEVEEIVSRELLQMMKIHSFKPDLFKIFRYKNAIPQYGLSTEKRYETIDQIQQKYPGLVLAGNIRNGIGMADRIKQARTIAEELF